MADEITVTLRATVDNGEYHDEFRGGTFKFDQAAIGAHGPVVSVGTAEEDLTTGDISTLGFLFLKNTDVANYVTYGPKSAGVMVPFGRIKAGEVACVRLEPGITLRWQANTAAVKVQILLLEN